MPERQFFFRHSRDVVGVVLAAAVVAAGDQEEEEEEEAVGAEVDEVADLDVLEWMTEHN